MTHNQPRIAAGVTTAGRWTTAQRAEPTVQLSTDGTGVPCVRRPSTQFRHFDGPCQCFFGGPAPQFPPSGGIAPS